MSKKKGNQTVKLSVLIFFTAAISKSFINYTIERGGRFEFVPNDRSFKTIYCTWRLKNTIYLIKTLQLHMINSYCN